MKKVMGTLSDIGLPSMELILFFQNNSSTPSVDGVMKFYEFKVLPFGLISALYI